MSKDDVEKYAFESHGKTSVIVSISNVFSMPAYIVSTSYNKIIDVLNLEFNDTEVDDYISGGILKEDADKIAKFVDKYHGKVDRIICQCTKGQSRSAAVAKAIMDTYEYDNSEAIKEYILNEDEYHEPNNLVYEKVLYELDKHVN